MGAQMAAMTKHRARIAFYAAMRALIRAIDKRMRRKLRIFEFNDAPYCIFRASIHPIAQVSWIPQDMASTGAKVIALHLWNEQVPPMPPGGPDLAYAKNLIRVGTQSLRMLAEYVLTDSQAADVVGICGRTSMFFSRNIQTGKKIFARLGMQIGEHQPSTGPVDRFFTNLYAWMLMWTYNPGILRARTPLKVDWYAFWISREALVKNFTGPNANGLRAAKCRDQTKIEKETEIVEATKNTGDKI
jgi:hypothetical protein